MRCQRCEGEQFVKAGFDRAKRQMYCMYDLSAPPDSALRLRLLWLPLPR